ncbi:MAG: DUF4838 domain-containing protein, partial [Kiritimatiellae bacterium]|nr:DUF4838 domain-containing protein [Kiritimatiellia bacterium]
MNRKTLYVVLLMMMVVQAWAAEPAKTDKPCAFQTRGVVLTPSDLSLDWPERAVKAGLTTIALHPFPGVVGKFIESPDGQTFLAKCARLGLNVEYELHAMGELLPRSFFAKEPECFRINDKGVRTPEGNLCVHSARALEIVSSNAVKIARQLKPTTGRYFFWGDDGKPWCRCQQCREYSDSDQALLLENHLVRELRRVDPRAQLAHLAYHNTIKPPTHVKPEPGVFLEFAPIYRRYDMPYVQQNKANDKDSCQALVENLKVFPVETAQVLEYWLDASKFSKWKRPSVKLPWRRDVLIADAEYYARLGVRHVTTFAVYVDADYIKLYGDAFEIQEYGDVLRNQRTSVLQGSSGVQTNEPEQKLTPAPEWIQKADMFTSAGWYVTADKPNTTNSIWKGYDIELKDVSVERIVRLASANGLKKKHEQVPAVIDGTFDGTEIKGVSLISHVPVSQMAFKQAHEQGFRVIPYVHFTDIHSFYSDQDIFLFQHPEVL